ncbi:MAG: recombinase family protein [Methanobrevibacter sp.]|nr:recombinase family protein [Methanobrevibacter sp.]
MKVGYVRVSTKEQNTIRQEVIMNNLGVEKVFIEKISGKNMNRPELKNLLAFVREGDEVIVESYSRLARSTQDLLTIISELNSKGVSFQSQKENIDTSTPQGRLVMTLFAGLAQFERECLLERQREGIKCAKEAGKYKGRKPIDVPENFESIVAEWKAGNINAREAIEKSGMTQATFYRKAKELN